jgi:hypothetical protein
LESINFGGLGVLDEEQVCRLATCWVAFARRRFREPGELGEDVKRLSSEDGALLPLLLLPLLWSRSTEFE